MPLPHLAFAACLVQALVPVLPALGLGQPVGAGALDGQPSHPLELPPGPFFAIWSLIFLLMAASAAAALWRRALAPVLAPALAPLAAAALGNALWMLAAQLGAERALLTLGILPLAALALTLLARANRLAPMPPGPSAPPAPSTAARAVLLLRAAAGLLAGWLTVAGAISVTMLWRAEWQPTEPVSLALGVGALALAALAGELAWRRAGPNPFYALALAWGFAGVGATAVLTLDLPLLALPPGLAALAALGAAGLAARPRAVQGRTPQGSAPRGLAAPGTAA